MSTFFSQIDTILTGLGDAATAEEIDNALRVYSRRDIQAVLAARASDEGGGAALTVTGDTGSVGDVTTLNLAGSTVAETAPGIAEAVVNVPVQTLTVTVEDAAIKTLPTTRVPVVDGAGAGTMLIPLTVVIQTDFSVAYSNGNADNKWLSVVYGDDDLEALEKVYNVPSGVHYLNDFLGFTTPIMHWFRYSVLFSTTTLSKPQTIDVATLNNSPLNLYTNNSGDFTGGDPANSLTVTTLYMVLDL